MRLKFNPSFHKKADKLKLKAKRSVENTLQDMAEDAMTRAVELPFTVDTGAYATSFSISSGAGRPRGKSPKNRPKMSVEAAKEEGLANLYRDIDKVLSKDDINFITISNGSPHAGIVENGNQHTRGKYLFLSLASKFTGRF